MQNRRFMRAQAILNALPIVPHPPITLLALAAKPSVQAYLPTGSSTASVHKLLRKDLLWLEAQFGPDIRVEEGGNGRATRYSRTPQAQGYMASDSVMMAFALTRLMLCELMPPDAYRALEQQVRGAPRDVAKIHAWQDRIVHRLPVLIARKVDPEVSRVVYQAIEQRLGVQLGVRAGFATQGTVLLCLHPVGLLFDQGVRHLVGMDDQGRWRTIALAKLQSAHLLGPVPAHVEAHRLIDLEDQGLLMESGQGLGLGLGLGTQIRLALQVINPRILEELQAAQLGDEMHPKPLSAGRHRLCSQVILTVALLDWLVARAADVQVLTPVAVAAHVRQRLLEGLKAYPVQP